MIMQMELDYAQAENELEDAENFYLAMLDAENIIADSAPADVRTQVKSVIAWAGRDMREKRAQLDRGDLMDLTAEQIDRIEATDRAIAAYNAKLTTAQEAKRANAALDAAETELKSAIEALAAIDAKNKENGK